MKKKLLALVLSLALALALLPTTALAAPQSSYTSSAGYTVNVTPAPAALTDSQHRGEGVFVKEENKTYTFCDVNGNTLGTGTGYTLMGHFHDGRAPVKAYDAYTAEERYGYIDRTGKLVIPAQFDRANVFNSGRAVVEQGGKKFYIDTAGNRAISGDFLECPDFNDGIAVVVVPAQYTGDGHQANERHGQLIDINGNVIYDFPAQWKDYVDWSGVLGTYQEDTISASLFTFRDGWVPIRDEQDKLALMDKTGARRPIPELNGASLVAYLGNDRLLVQKNAKRAIIDMNGTMLLPYLYDYMALRCENNFRYGVTRLEIFGGILDAAGNIVVPADWAGDDGWIGEIVDGMAVGSVWDSINYKRIPYLFWTPDCPYGPGASGQDPTPAPTPAPQPTPVQPPAGKLAYASTQEIEVDGKKATFEAYALKDANGNDTNYIKLRDVAYVLNGTAAQFEVGWNGSVTITTGQPYTPNGSEMSTPYSGDRPYQDASAATVADGSPVELSAILLTDDSGSGYTYYKLRDLGEALGFKVDWSAERGIFIETN